jgi:hypothetical protein
MVDSYGCAPSLRRPPAASQVPRPVRAAFRCAIALFGHATDQADFGLSINSALLSGRNLRQLRTRQLATASTFFLSFEILASSPLKAPAA